MGMISFNHNAHRPVAQGERGADQKSLLLTARLPGKPALRLDADLVVHGGSNSLLAARGIRDVTSAAG
jgi:hypothetical protein